MAKKGGKSHAKKCEKYKSEKRRESNKKRKIEKQENIYLKHVEKVTKRVNDGTATPKMLKQIKRYKVKGLVA